MRRHRRARPWPPPGVNPWRTSVDYLAFAVARPELERRSARLRSVLIDVVESSRGNWHGPPDLRAAAQVRIDAYVTACYSVIERFSGEDGNVLRLAGILPRDFYREVDREVRLVYRHDRVSRRAQRRVRQPVTMPATASSTTSSTSRRRAHAVAGRTRSIS